MYSTCLFCNGALGRNEAIEGFSVGRRLAFDAAKGRLWAICPRCARWNLSPLETRWEAIEEAERAYRDAPLRSSTGQIGLARLREGTELVRIGQPMLPEFAAWRYGRMFTRRYRRAQSVAYTGIAASLLHAGLSASGLVFSGWNAGAASLVGSSAVLGSTAFSIVHGWRQERVARLAVRDNEGTLLRLSANDASRTAMVNRDDDVWSLRVQYREPRPTGAVLRSVGMPSRVRRAEATVLIEGDAARRALASLLPSVNAGGADRTLITTALEIVSQRGSLKDTYLAREDSEGRSLMKLPKLSLGGLPGGFRLGLEMKLHEQDERRALDGELAELEERWREAEEIAATADSMLLPESVEQGLRDMHARNRSQLP